MASSTVLCPPTYSGKQLNNRYMSKFGQMKDMVGLAKKAKQIQKELRETEIEAASSDGLVRVVFNAEQHIKSVSISEEALAPDKKGQLEKSLVAVISEAISKAQGVAAERMKEVAGALNLPGF